MPPSGFVLQRRASMAGLCHTERHKPCLHQVSKQKWSRRKSLLRFHPVQKSGSIPRRPDWVGFFRERRRGIVGRLFHGPQNNVEFDAVRLTDAVLSSSELISGNLSPALSDFLIRRLASPALEDDSETPWRPAKYIYRYSERQLTRLHPA
jgi:hypothetical protein